MFKRDCNSGQKNSRFEYSVHHILIVAAALIHGLYQAEHVKPVTGVRHLLTSIPLLININPIQTCLPAASAASRVFYFFLVEGSNKTDFNELRFHNISRSTNHLPTSATLKTPAAVGLYDITTTWSVNGRKSLTIIRGTRIATELKVGMGYPTHFSYDIEMRNKTRLYLVKSVQTIKLIRGIGL